MTTITRMTTAGTVRVTTMAAIMIGAGWAPVALAAAPAASRPYNVAINIDFAGPKAVRQADARAGLAAVRTRELGSTTLTRDARGRFVGQVLLRNVHLRPDGRFVVAASALGRTARVAGQAPGTGDTITVNVTEADAAPAPVHVRRVIGVSIRNGGGPRRLIGHTASGIFFRLGGLWVGRATRIVDARLVPAVAGGARRTIRTTSR